MRKEVYNIMGDKIMAALKSTAAKIIYVIAGILFISIFSSWTTQKNIQSTMSDYANYQFAESVNSVLNKTGGVIDQIHDVKKISEETQCEVMKSNSAMYADWCNDINKYYAWCDGNHNEMLSAGYAVKMSNYWVNLPDSYKTDIIKTHYNYAFDYINKTCK